MIQDKAKSETKKISRYFVKIMVGLFFILMAYWIIGPEHHNEKTIDMRSAFYTQKVAPELERFARENQAAAKHAVWKIKSAFNHYRKHTPEFVEDMSSLTTTAAAVWKGGKDFASMLANHDPKAEAFSNYTRKKFEKYFFGQKELEALLEDTLLQYADNVRANQNLLHMRVEKAWKEADMPGKFNWAPVMADVNTRIRATTAGIGGKGIESMLLATIGGSFIGYGSEKLVEAYAPVLITWISEKLAASVVVAAEGAGSIALVSEGGAAAGGLFGGPVGSAIGIIGGMAGCIVADYFVQKHFRKKMTLECNNLLTAIENGIINGRPGAPGLLAAMQSAGNRIAVAERKALKKALMNG